MYILSFETSCDDTSIAVLHNETLLSLVTHTQTEHNKTGGVVPEVAARSHEEKIFSQITLALEQANIQLENITHIACTGEPGLLPSLIIGKTVAKSFGKLLGIPVYFMNHIRGHIYSIFLDRQESEILFPCIGLSVSGGHNHIYSWGEWKEPEKIWESRDDSAGEAFDKVARMLGLSYPWGPHIEQEAKKYSGEYENIFPIVLLEKESLDFSFSGLKSAVRRYIEKSKDLDEKMIQKICFEFQETVIRIFIEKIHRALKKNPEAKQIFIVGGVSANQTFKQALEKNFSLPIIFPKKWVYSTDNAAMIGIQAYFQIKKSEKN